jgi:inorganic pyrophosphatase
MFPLVISSTGILVGVFTHFFATDFWPVQRESDVLRALKVQIAVSTGLSTAALWPIIVGFLPHQIELGLYHGTHIKVFFSIGVGLWGGCIIGFVTEYFTSYDYRPTQEVAESTETGAATNIIYGLALGYKSAVIPILVLSVDVFVSFHLLGMYGLALCALGMLMTLSSCLTIDVYGPISDNAGGIAEMSGLPSCVRQKTDALDAAGNTTAAIGKGFAIGSAALVSLSLIGAFVTRVRNHTVSQGALCGGGIDILQPITFASLISGAMVPYWFSALTMKSVGTAAMAMVKEVARQFREIPGLLEGTPGHGEPDHAKCIKIATDASLREMVLPGALVVFAPLFCGILFGVDSVVGLLSGALTSGIQLAVSMSNTGGAWDNAKKYVEKGGLSFEVNGVKVVQKKGSDAHKAAVIGDTVGDPFKDTSGPAINIVMKLMAIISVVFADFFVSIRNGYGAFHIVPYCEA